MEHELNRKGMQMDQNSETPNVQAPGSQPEKVTGDAIRTPDDAAVALGSLDSGDQTTPDEQSKPAENENPDPKPDSAAVETPNEKPEEPATKEAAESNGGDELPERVQKRFSELTARRYAAEEKAEALQAKLTAAEKSQAESLGVHPMFLQDGEAEVIRQVNDLEQQHERLFTNLDGYDDPNDPAKSMTAEQVRREFSRVQRQLFELKPKAAVAYNRAQAEMLEALKLGREVQAARKAGKAEGGTDPSASLRADKTDKTEKVPAGSPRAVVPKLPVAPSVARGSVSAGKHGGPSKERFEAAGATEEAAAAELSLI